MIDHRHYMPILKWRMGEWQALEKLSPPVKERTVPLLEIPREKWDFELEQPAATLDEHLPKLAKAVQRKWPRLCYFDCGLLEPAARMANGQHPVQWFFDQVRGHGHHYSIPVTGLDRDAAYQAATATVIAQDKRGVCIRLIMEDFDRPDFAADLSDLLTTLGVTTANADMVVDYKAGPFTPITSYATTMLNTLNALPLLARWRSLTVAGTAFPKDLPAVIYRPSAVAPRHEWVGYKALCARLPGTVRIPTFGDYAVVHPSQELLNMAVLDPTAKLKYTIDDAWYIAVGQQVKAHGRAQMQGMCAALLANSHFAGPGFSWGDQYIADCAAGTVSTGGTTTFPQVASNHHITKVVTDVASYHGP